MSFVKLEKRVSINDTRLGASMSMRIYSASPKPVAFVSLRKHFLETAKFKSLHFDVAVGEGVNAGKIRITPNKDGAFAARELKSALVIDLGHVAQLGEREHKNRSAEVGLVDGAAVVTIPDWNTEPDDDDDLEEEDDDDTADEMVVERRVTSSPPPPPRAPSSPPPKAATAAPRAVTHKGIIINLTAGSEAVSYKGESVEVSPRGARLVEMLAKVMPACIGDSFIVSQCWDQKPSAAQAPTLLDMVCRDLLALKKLGLEVRNQRGVGRQLVEIGK